MELLLKSLQFDYQFLFINKIGIVSKFNFLFQKYFCILSIFIYGKGFIKINDNVITCESVSDIGTLQSSLCDIYYDLYNTTFFREFENKEFIVIDIGANIGQFTNGIKYFFSKSQIYSFEPDTKIFKKLEKNVKKLDNTKIYNFGIGDINEEKTFYVSKLSLESSFEKPAEKKISNFTESKFLVKKLDDVEDIKLLKRINLLKIDVEGFEKQVIDGALNTLKKVDYVLVEVSLERQTEFSNIDLISKIKLIANDAKIVRVGRLLGSGYNQICVDFLIKLK